MKKLQKVDLQAVRELEGFTDEQLLSLVIGGCHDALTVLFDRYQRLVYSIALRIVRDTGEAEEVVQTVFLDIFRAAANFDPKRGTLKVWMLQYAYNRALHRRRHLVANHFYRWEDLEAAIDAGAQQPLATDMREAAWLVEAMLEKLKPRRRRVIEMTYYEGLTAEEIAAKLGESVIVVRHHLYRGLAAMRKTFQKSQGSENSDA